MKLRELNERRQARLTTRILTNSRVFRHARVLVIYKESSRRLIARPFGFRQIGTVSPRKARAERHPYDQVISAPARCAVEYWLYRRASNVEMPPYMERIFM